MPFKETPMPFRFKRTVSAVTSTACHFTCFCACMTARFEGSRCSACASAHTFHKGCMVISKAPALRRDTCADQANTARKWALGLCSTPVAFNLDTALSGLNKLISLSMARNASTAASKAASSSAVLECPARSQSVVPKPSMARSCQTKLLRTSCALLALSAFEEAGLGRAFAPCPACAQAAMPPSPKPSPSFIH